MWLRRTRGHLTLPIAPPPAPVPRPVCRCFPTLKVELTRPSHGVTVTRKGTAVCKCSAQTRRIGSYHYCQIARPCPVPREGLLTAGLLQATMRRSAPSHPPPPPLPWCTGRMVPHKGPGSGCRAFPGGDLGAQRASTWGVCESLRKTKPPRVPSAHKSCCQGPAPALGCGCCHLAPPAAPRPGGHIFLHRHGAHLQRWTQTRGNGDSGRFSG